MHVGFITKYEVGGGGLAKHLAKQRLADVLAVSDTTRDREEGRAGLLQILAEAVTEAKLHLDRDEMGTRVVDVGKEEQPGVHTARAVTPVNQVVAAAEHFGAAVVARLHHPYVRIGRH